MSDTLAEKLRQITADDNDEADILFEAADRIEALERLEKQMPAILEYLEEQADVVDGDNGIPHPNKAMTLLVWLRHEMEK
jgi:hypothetical protein